MRKHAGRLLLTVLMAPLAAHAQTATAFLTSVTGTGNLGSWPDAGGASGAAAGDAICRARAQASGLPEPELYMAWISTSPDDAWCRLRGLTGKRETNCGQPPGPLPARGPWHLSSSLPFMDALDAIDDGRVWRAPDTTEFGQIIVDPDRLATMTATSYSGVGEQEFTCQNWTATPDGVAGSLLAGWPNRTSADWSGDFRRTSCSLGGRLLCLQARAAAPIRQRDWGRPAFLSVSLGNGNLASWALASGASGLAAGDAVCRAEAASAGLPLADTFRAWLSDGSTDARDRFDWDGPWARLDGVRIADGLADLTDARQASAINLQPDGVHQVGVAPFTGTRPDGTAAASHCVGWTAASASDMGVRGRSNAVDAHWTEHLFGGPAGFPCSLNGRLYCLSDSDQLFADGAEWPLYD